MRYHGWTISTTHHISHFHPDVRDVFPNWDAKREERIHNEGVRIDYAACSKGFLSQVIATEIV